MLYEKEPTITQDFRRHRSLKPDLRSTIRDPGGLVVIAERAAVDARVEPHADYASAFLEAECCLFNQGLCACGPGPLRNRELLLGANPRTHW